MAIVGCSYLKGGIYNNNNGVVTYSDQAVIAKLVRMSLTMEDSADNDFYADNGVDETDNQFAGGTYEVNTNDLTDAMSALILGLQTNTLTSITGVTDTGVKEVIFDDRQNTPYMGIGNVVKHPVVVIQFAKRELCGLCRTLCRVIRPQVPIHVFGKDCHGDREELRLTGPERANWRFR